MPCHWHLAGNAYGLVVVGNRFAGRKLIKSVKQGRYGYPQPIGQLDHLIYGGVDARVFYLVDIGAIDVCAQSEGGLRETPFLSEGAHVHAKLFAEVCADPVVAHVKKI